MVAFAGDPANFGTATDPMVGKPIGGVVAFGGGLALYDDNGIVGGLGVSGNSSVPTTMSLGGFGRPWVSTRCRRA